MVEVVEDGHGLMPRSPGGVKVASDVVGVAEVREGGGCPVAVAEISEQSSGMRRYTRPLVVSFTAVFSTVVFFAAGFLAAAVRAPADCFAALVGAALGAVAARVPRAPRRGACSDTPLAAVARAPRRSLGVPAAVGCATLASLASVASVASAKRRP